jgi:SHS2 domain-containing protein
MAEDPESIVPARTVTVECGADSPDMLLFRFLGELVYLKDARGLLLRAAGVRIRTERGGYALSAEMSGEEIDPERHRMIVDVKAVTLHRLKVEERNGVWTATVVVDV